MPGAVNFIIIVLNYSYDKEYMRRYIVILFVLFLFIALLAVYYVLDTGYSLNDIIVHRGIKWNLKQREIKSRLLAIPILLYHNIDGPGVFSLQLEKLRSHFQFLRDNNIKVIRLSELIERSENPMPFKEKAVVITFDDGFFSMHSKLLPLVKEFGYPVTLFVYVDNIYTKAKKSLTWDQLKELEKNGIDIECHSVSHADLLRLSNQNTMSSKRQLFEEIYLSKRIMELYLPKKIRYFAFPYGRYDLKIIDMCASSGYRRVFSTDYGSNIITRNNYCLRRRHIKRNTNLKLIEDIIK
jgi:peptidoglycan/xylan/chitin deacetylase (PgdA/CDA1 family)